MSIERVAAGLNTLNEILARPTSDPDPDRQDWGIHSNVLDTLITTAEQEVLDPLEATLAEMGSDTEQTERLCNVAADRLGDAAGLLFAAGRDVAARRLLQKACTVARPGQVADLCAAGLADSVRFTAVIRAWWLVHQDRRKEATAVAQGLLDGAPTAIAESAQQIVDAGRPLSSPPALFGINGFGLRVYGERDHRPNGTYVTTRYLTALFVPLLPVDAFRVAKAPDGGGWYFLAKAQLSAVATWWRRLLVLGIAVAIVWGALSRHYGSPGYRMGQAIEAAQAAESAAGPDERAEVIDRYEAIIVEFADQPLAELKPAVDGFVRLAVASIAAPLTTDRLAEVKRLALRYRALPEVAHQPTLVAPMLAALEGWAEQLGTDDHARILGALEILGHAEALAGRDADALPRIRDRRNALNRELAAGLATDWPLEAIRQYASMSEDRESVIAAAALLDELGDGPSVWIELAPTVQRWQARARSVPELADSRETAMGRVAAAQAMVAAPEREALLAEPERAALQEAIAATPGDQELAVALADLELRDGNAAAALATLTAIGPPGQMVLEAQAALASAYADTGREAEADALLERVLSSRLPAFESARRVYGERVESLSDQLVARAQRGDMPAPLRSRLEAASPDDQQKIFSEWLDDQITNDVQLSQLRDEYTALSGVVSIAIQWGTLKLRRANEQQGAARQELLDGAERAFLSISTEGSGIPSYHLGLGQVYYRLGKEEEGERELRNLLDDEPMEIQLAVAKTYRELGLMARAREEGQRIFDAAEAPVKQSAAVLMSMMATDSDERRQWLSSADASSPAVRLRLLELDAVDLLDAGEAIAADAKFAEVAEGWTEQSAHDSAASNNAAIAMLARYSCTGDADRLRDAVRMLEQARALEADNALVVGNLASAVEMLAVVEILDGFVRTEPLRLALSEMHDLVGAINSGPEHAAFVEAMNRSKTLRHALDLHRQHQVLGPKSPDSYGSLLAWHTWREDDKALQELGRRLTEAQIDLSDAATAEAEHRDPAHDAEQIEDMQRRLDHYGRIARAVERSGHRPTQAALAYLVADMQHARATIDRDRELAREAARGFAAATARWAGLGTADHARTLVDLALWEAMAAAGSDASAYDERRRELGQEALLAWILAEDQAVATAMGARPELAEALGLRRGVEGDLLRTFDWMLARLGADAELRAAARASVSRPVIRAGYDIARALTPNPEAFDLILRQLDAGD